MARLARLVLLLLVLLSGCDGYDPDKTAAYLADLGITGYQLEPSFSSSTFDYVATIPPGTDSITVEVDQHPPGRHGNGQRRTGGIRRRQYHPAACRGDEHDQGRGALAR